MTMKNIKLLDGAMGTSLWALAEKKGLDKVPVWKYNIECPQIVEEVTKQFAAAGAEIVQTNTFGANRPAVRRSSDYDVKDVIRSAVRINKKALEGTGASGAVSFGPLAMLLEPYGDLTYEEAADIYGEMVDAAVEEGADFIIFETFMDEEMMKIAAQSAKRYDVKVACSLSFEKQGRTIMGNSVQSFVDLLTPVGIDAIGMNCSIGPDLALPIIKEFSEKTDIPLFYKPNAGKPIMSSDGSTVSTYDAKTFVKDVEPALEYVTYLGGCCGCGPDYIKELADLVNKRR